MPHRASVRPGSAPAATGEALQVDVAVVPPPSPHAEDGATKPFVAVRKHPFLEAAHHPFIAGISHIWSAPREVSPLSAALLVFGIHKWWQRGAMNAWADAHRAMRTAPTRPSPAAAKAHTPESASGVRHFSTYASAGRFLRSTPPVRSVSVGVGLSPWKLRDLQQRWYTMPSNRGLTASLSALCMDRMLHGASCTPGAAGVPAAAEAAMPLTIQSAPKHSTTLALATASGAATTMASEPTLADIYGAEDVPLVLSHLSELWSVVQMQDLIAWLHAAQGLPWWAAIGSATVLLRLAAMPFEVLQLRNSLRLKRILPRVEHLHAELKAAVTAEEKKVHAQALLQLYKDERCSPMHGLYIPFLFPPVFLSLFGATHNLALSEPSMVTGGGLWCTDLVLPDPTWMLPVASSLTWLWLLHRTAGSFYVSNLNFRLVCCTTAVAFIPVVANMPAGVFCFWITSNLFSLARVVLLNTDAVRRLLSIPLSSEISALAHIPRSIDELLTPVELRALVKHAKHLAKEDKARHH